MAAKIVDISTLQPTSMDVYFFDNNIWMYIFCPLGNYNKRRQNAYSSFLQSVNTVGATIFINSLILSEFTNRYLRMDFEQWKEQSRDNRLEFKRDYIGTNRYKNTVNEIKLHIQSIMRFCEKSSDNFNAIRLDNVLTHLSEIDFNDSYYIELMPKINAKFVSDDGDFLAYKNHDLEIITYQ